MLFAALPANTGACNGVYWRDAETTFADSLLSNKTSFTYVSLRWADVAVCRNADASMTANIWRTGAMTAEQSRRFAQRRDNSETTPEEEDALPACNPHCGPDTERDWEGCAGHKVAQTEGAAVACCLYPQTTATPSLWVTPPQVRWTSAASSLFPKEFYFPKVKSQPCLLPEVHSSGLSL